jgi:hypothetical protein
MLLIMIYTYSKKFKVCKVPISFHFISSVVFNVKSLYIDAVFEDFDALWF